MTSTFIDHRDPSMAWAGLFWNTPESSGWMKLRKIRFEAKYFHVSVLRRNWAKGRLVRNKPSTKHRRMHDV